MKFKMYKNCPRCEIKMDANLVVCPNCQLNFNKFNEATNAEAKEALKHGEKENVLMRKGYPTDVNKVAFILLTIFLGFTGAHYYKVGRYKMGIFFSFFFLIGVANAVLSIYKSTVFSGNMGKIFYLLVLIWGVVLLIWVFDIYKVCFNKFKIPVSRRG